MQTKIDWDSNKVTLIDNETGIFVSKIINSKYRTHDEQKELNNNAKAKLSYYLNDILDDMKKERE